MIFFDFDGVIGDTLILTRRACRFALLEQYPQSEAIIAENPFDGLDLVTFEALGETLACDPHQFTRDLTGYIAAQDPPALFDGMAGVIHDLAQRDMLWLMSANSEIVLRRTMRANGLEDAFSGIASGDLAGSKASKMQAILAGNTAGAVMVGDAVSDVTAAEQAGIPAICVSWGWHSAERLRRAGAAAIADTPVHLGALLAEFRETAA